MSIEINLNTPLHGLHDLCSILLHDETKISPHCLAASDWMGVILKSAKR